MIEGAIVVTGASRGIGAAISIELARRGFIVGCVSRTGDKPEGYDSATPECRERMLIVTSDVAQEESFAGSLKDIAERAGGIAGLVNNAGIHREESSHTLSTADFEYVFRVNTTAVFTACRDAYPYLIAGKGGLIVNIGSFYDKLGVKRNSAYCASKAAVAALTRCLAAEWGKQGVAVLNVAPGYVETEINRAFLNDAKGGERVRSRSFINRAGDVGEIARLVASLYVEDIKFLTGETIYIDGGHALSL